MAKCVAVVQARLSSKRLPKKVLAKLGDRTMLEQIVRRCKAARTIESVVVACPIGDDQEIFESTGIMPIPGSEEDLVSRLTDAAKTAQATHFVRVTADCPFVCPRLIEFISWSVMNGTTKVVTNWKQRTFPDGLDLDAWDIEWLLKQQLKDKEYFAQEIIQTYPKEDVLSLENPVDMSLRHRLTVDYPDDLDMARRVYAKMGQMLWDSQTVIDFLDHNPKIAGLNKKRMTGDFGLKKSSECQDDQHRGTECKCCHAFPHCCSHHCCCFYRCKCRHAQDRHPNNAACDFGDGCKCKKYDGELR